MIKEIIIWNSIETDGIPDSKEGTYPECLVLLKDGRTDIANFTGGDWYEYMDVWEGFMGTYENDDVLKWAYIPKGIENNIEM
jgi:hypothetical protein